MNQFDFWTPNFKKNGRPLKPSYVHRNLVELGFENLFDGKVIDDRTALEIKLDDMLDSQPVGASERALVTFEKIGPLTVEGIKKLAPEYAPVNVDGVNTKFKTWRNLWQDKCFGQVNKQTDFKIVREGIVRKIDRGSIWEGQYAHDNLHGYLRVIKSDGSYYTCTYKDGVLEGGYQCFKADGTPCFWTDMKLEDGEIKERTLIENLKKSEEKLPDQNQIKVQKKVVPRKMLEEKKRQELKNIIIHKTFIKRPQFKMKQKKSLTSIETLENIKHIYGPTRSRNITPYQGKGGSMDQKRTQYFIKQNSFERNPYSTKDQTRGKQSQLSKQAIFLKMDNEIKEKKMKENRQRYVNLVKEARNSHKQLEKIDSLVIEPYMNKPDPRRKVYLIRDISGPYQLDPDLNVIK